jgi:hypothetical protein
MRQTCGTSQFHRACVRHRPPVSLPAHRDEAPAEDFDNNNEETCNERTFLSNKGTQMLRRALWTDRKVEDERVNDEAFVYGGRRIEFSKELHWREGWTLKWSGRQTKRPSHT